MSAFSLARRARHAPPPAFRPRALLPLALALAGAGGCSRDAIEDRMSRADSVRAEDPVWKSTRPARTTAVSMTEPNVVAVAASDYAFDLPTELPAGFTTLRLTNDGAEPHNLQLVKVSGRPGQGAGDFIQAMQEGKPRPSWAVDVGGPNAAAPGGTSNVTFLLEPGEYAVLCPIRGRDGEPHTMKGMVRPLTVTREGARSTPEPEADLTMTLVDYGYELGRPLTAGEHTIRIDNTGKQPHEVLLVRLAAGKRAQDYAAWYERQVGPAPGELVGGVAAISPGRSGTVTANFAAGEYALLCLIPDVKDGRPHVAHGMIRQIRIA